MPDLVVFSHLRWNFVFQRPQHLMTRFGRAGRVWFIEEPLDSAGPPRVVRTETAPGVTVCVPHLSAPHSGFADERLRRLFDALLEPEPSAERVLWYYTPMALPHTRHLPRAAVVYDCMDELSAFAGAPQGLVLMERQLLKMADLVFTGGHSLYNTKRRLHGNVHAFPSSVDLAHYHHARTGLPCPDDQAGLARPRIGYFGVIDERIDYDLLAGIVAHHPEWQLVMIGPVAKVDPASLPRAANLHWLGMKPYAQLPGYVGSWDVAMMPFAENESTRYISPTKTLEYLAAGIPVVSTPIQDVVDPYGHLELVRIGRGAAAFAEAIEDPLQAGRPRGWLEAVDRMLTATSWDRTHARMDRLLRALVQKDAAPAAVSNM